ncbi:MAG: sugar phosphate isomerase/epimerase, partial [Bacteroidetes bacterium]|nr:sugar phosphate isomerase/epimerase [Bacteroidota bacterium]
MKNLGFQSIELEGIRETHLLQIYDQRFAIKEKLDQWQLQVPYFCAVLPGLGSADAEVREKQLDLFRTGCEIAQIFGAKGILDNGPLPPYIFPEDIPVVRHYETDVLKLATLPENLDWKTYWKNLLLTFQKACDIAAEYHLTYQIHP